MKFDTVLSVDHFFLPCLSVNTQFWQRFEVLDREEGKSPPVTPEVSGADPVKNTYSAQIQKKCSLSLLELGQPIDCCLPLVQGWLF